MKQGARFMKGKVEESSRPPLGEIKVIIGGTSTGQSSKSKKTYLKVVQNIQLSGWSPRTRGTDKLAITFTDEDAERIHHPHDDAIVITLLIMDYTTRMVLVDNGSLADILYVRTYVIHLLGTYVTILCNWLILWQNALYLYFGRSGMCLILQETCCSSLVLKPWRLDQETSEENLFTKAGQIARHLRTDSLTPARHLSIDRG